MPGDRADLRGALLSTSPASHPETGGEEARGAVLAAASELNSLRVPPANRLEKLKGDREGMYSIRINEQWRLCFTWIGADAHDVEIVDYHRR